MIVLPAKFVIYNEDDEVLEVIRHRFQKEKVGELIIYPWNDGDGPAYDVDVSTDTDVEIEHQKPLPKIIKPNEGFEVKLRSDHTVSGQLKISWFDE